MEGLAIEARPLLDEALRLAAEGVEVFPVGKDKSPRTPHGFKDASSDPAVIRKWHWPWDDVLIAAAIPQGRVIIDIDPRNGGNDTVNALVAAGQEFPTTKTVLTRSGGTHLYYRVPEGLELRAGLGPGIDVKRAGKGYVVVPPSEGYTNGASQLIADAPAWLLEELAVPVRESGPRLGSPPKYFPFESGTGFGLRQFERETGKLAQAEDGGRNDALNRAAFVAFQLVAGGELSEDFALETLTRVADRIGLEPDETAKTIDSGLRAGLEEPWQAPTDVALETNPRVEVKLEEGDEEREARLWVDWNIDEEPPPFYLDPLLPKNAYVIVYGPTEAAKSMAWMGILAQGSNEAGIRSSIYSLENPPATDRDRLRRWAPDPANFRLTNEGIDFNDPRQVEALIAREKAWGTDVIMVDTYSHAFNSRSEDGNAKAIEFARRVRWVMAQVGCSFIVVDHTGFEGDEPRDASAKRQQVDVAIHMRKLGQWALGEPARFSMMNRKAARFGNPFSVAGAIHDVRGSETRALEIKWEGKGPTWEA